MISMTGYSHVSKKDKNRKYEISITSINSRFLDIHVYFPLTDALLEEKVRASIQKVITRGKVSVKLSWQSEGGSRIAIKMNQQVLEQCLKQTRNFARKSKLKNDVSMKDLVGLPFAWSVSEKKEHNINYTLVERLMKEALVKLKKSRETEGQRLKKKIISYINEIKRNITSLKRIRAVQVRELNAKLKKKLRKLKKSADSGEKTSIEREINYILVKGDIEEELVRLSSHIVEVDRIIKGKDSVGKKMGFMLQELTRECNTIGDKLMHVKGKHTALNNKMLIEKVREQLQNIE